MESLKSLIEKQETALRLDSQLPSDEFCLGMIMNSYLAEPSVEKARHVLKYFSSLPERSKPYVGFAFYEILMRILEHSNKVDEVASLLECSIKLSLDLGNTILNEKVAMVFDALLERITSTQGLPLLKYLKAFNLPHYTSNIDLSTLTHLDLTNSSRFNEIFSSILSVLRQCKEVKKYTILNTLAYECIEFNLLYKVEDLRGYQGPLEQSLLENLDNFTYSQRLKLSKIYKKKIEITQKIVKTTEPNQDFIEKLEATKFTDQRIIKPDFLEFTFLIEDILQFNLSNHVIRQRIKSLRGMNSGKDFSLHLFQAILAVKDDEPGYKVLEIIMNVLKPLKLLSKNEFFNLKRSEKKIVIKERVKEEKVKIPEIFSFSEEKAKKFVDGFADEAPKDRDYESVRIVLEEFKGITKVEKVVFVGAFALGTWVKGFDVDVTIMQDDVFDKYSYLLSIKYQLLLHGSTELINLKSNPILKYKSHSSSFYFNITVNNTQAIQDYERLQPLLIPKIQNLIILVKSFAKSKNWTQVEKGNFSDYDWTLLCIAYCKQDNSNFSLSDTTIEKGFYRFIRFLFESLGKQIDVNKGTLKNKSKFVIGIINPAGGKEIENRIKIDRKQGKMFKSEIVKTINDLSF